MRRAALLAALSLAGCTGPERPVTQVPVALPCVRRDRLPPATPPLGPLPNDARRAADALAATLLEVRAENRLLRALLGACVQP